MSTTPRKLLGLAGKSCSWHNAGFKLNFIRESTLSTPGSRKSNSSSHRKPQASPVPLSERYSRDLHAKSQPKKELASKGYIPLSDSENEAGREISSGAAGPINLEDDDEGEIVAIISKPAIQVEEDPNFSDEEFPELARQARERAKQKELERLKAGHSFHDTNHDTSGSNTPVYIFDDVFEDRPAVQKDLAVEILVTSVIEGTKPLRVRRKLSQGLKEVRLIWCDKQLISGHPIPDSIKESIFLTWKGLRLWDLATCKSLGLKIDGSGHIMSNGEGFDSQRRIHFEAWTQDLFDANQRQLKAKQDRGDSEDEPEVIEQAVEQKMKLVMKARGMEPLKIFAKPTTTFERLAGAFRNSRDIPEGKDIILLFDGEKLDPNSTVEHVELDDMDNIEVHLR